ncbi:AMP-binding protein [Streptomyces rapamycinicus]|uniref:AMP-binding protein n=1 Tax=Streptomyces rapamycinicus TaxID=1226757 RepID=UPI001315A305
MAQAGTADLTDADRGCPLLPDHPAYLFYTSGSSGRPKGVVASRSGLGGFLRAMARRTPLTGADAALSTPSFDVVVVEWFMPLAAGARIVLASAAQTHDPAALLGLMGRHGVSMAQATPTLWQAVLSEVPDDGGDQARAVRGADPQRWRDAALPGRATAARARRRGGEPVRAHRDHGLVHHGRRPGR